MDSFFHVFEEFLPSPLERSVTDIVFSYLLRCTLVIFCIQEFTRFEVYMTTFALGSVFGFVSVLTKISHIKTSHRCIAYYVRLRVMITPVVESIGMLICGVMFVDHLMTLISLWMLIRCWKYMSFPIVFLAGIFFLFSIIFSALVLPILVSIELKSAELVRERRNGHYWATKRGEVKYYYKWWAAQKNFAFSCASFFAIGPSTIRDYVDWLTDNLASAVLLLDPAAF